jgi:hypothetical protein
MAYAIIYTTCNEDTGSCSSWQDSTTYETKGLAEYIANHAHYEYWTEVVVADNSVYIKEQVKAERIDQRDDFYYGSPTHQMFGDAWLYADCEGAW